MTAEIIDGQAVAKAIRAEVAAQAAACKAKGVTPGLAAVLVGDNPASVSYVTAKTKACAEAGIYSETIRLPGTMSQAELLQKINELNKDRRFHGILVQLPLPKQINEAVITNTVAPEKDVDGLGIASMGKLLLGEPQFIPCTPHGVLQVLLRTGHDPDGKHVVICGRSNLVGKPLAVLLMQKRKGANATVTVCHTGTRDLGVHTRQADILVVAAGHAKTVTKEMVKPGAVVIDVGVNRIEDSTKKAGFRLVGDVDFDSVKEVASAITPVPGGVGPLTVAMLLVNTVRSAELTLGKQ
jgi:methylenetetrahydrofolate dehydrogenase (NADP+)/methenyltetrahydrofolate cyclohydrolase